MSRRVYPTAVVAASRRLYRTAAGFEIIEHARNRLAIVLVGVFIPVWITLIRLTMSQSPIAFRYRGNDEVLRVNAMHLTLVSGGLNAVTLIVGFLMFSVTYRSGDFDRRLVAAGYPRRHLLLAKMTALMLSSVLVSVYATGVIWLYWPPEQPWLLWVSLFSSALTYGGIGIALGVVLRGELEGMFAIIMISIIDVGLESPVVNSSSDQDIVHYLPLYGSMQGGVGAGFTHGVPLHQLSIVALWWAGCALIGLIAFRRRTRIWTTRARPLPVRTREPVATVRPGPGETVHVCVRMCEQACTAPDHMPMYQGLAVLAALSAEQAAGTVEQNVYPLGIRARPGSQSAM
ncbi:MAG: ABC transporter permease [Kutzneria sp.]|nr:ABC transporter permease [Kutzneria sp.]